MKHLVVLGAGESGVGTALLAQSKGYEVFVSDFGMIQKLYKDVLLNNEIQWEEGGHNLERLTKSRCGYEESRNTLNSSSSKSYL